MSLRPYPLEIWREDNPLSVIAMASARRVCGEPGSLAITTGWEIDIARVSTVSGYRIETTASERENLQAQIINIVSS